MESIDYLQTRWQFWRGLHSHWIFKIVAVMWLLLGVVGTLLPFFPAKWSEGFYRLNYLPKWHWYVWIVGSLVIVIIAVFDASCRQIELLKKNHLIEMQRLSASHSTVDPSLVLMQERKNSKLSYNHCCKVTATI